MEKAEIGLIGLGVMGSNLALNIAEKGHRIAVYNRTHGAHATTSPTNAGRAARTWSFPATRSRSWPQRSRPPRPVIIMTQAGKPVDEQIALLRARAFDRRHHHRRRQRQFPRHRCAASPNSTARGLTFIGMGVSGGEEGARHGPSIMVGGTEASFKRVEKVLLDISAKYKGEPCAAWLGPNGAGHFVKTIHNGIEYADMQMIAEIYGVLRDGLGHGAEGDRRGLRRAGTRAASTPT